MLNRCLVGGLLLAALGVTGCGDQVSPLRPSAIISVGGDSLLTEQKIVWGYFRGLPPEVLPSAKRPSSR